MNQVWPKRSSFRVARARFCPYAIYTIRDPSPPGVVPDKIYYIHAVLPDEAQVTPDLNQFGIIFIPGRGHFSQQCCRHQILPRSVDDIQTSTTTTVSVGLLVGLSCSNTVGCELRLKKKEIDGDVTESAGKGLLPRREDAAAS